MKVEIDCMRRLGSALRFAATSPAVARWRNVALSLLALLIGVALWAHAIGLYPHTGYDFRAYLLGAQQIAAGVNPYHSLVTQPLDTSAGDSGFHAHGYVYPPLLGVLLAGPVRLGLSPYGVFLLWTLLNVAAVIWMGRELNIALRGKRDWPMTLAFAAVALLPAVVLYDLFLGQADVLMAALVVGACGLWLRKNPWAALALGAAIAVKPTMALLLVVWLWKGDWRATIRAAVAALALVALPFAIVGWNAFHDYVDFFIHWNAFSANAEYINQSPYGMLLRMFTVNPSTHPLIDAPWLVAPLRYLAALGALALWAWVTPRRPTSDRALAMGECLLALPLILLVSPLAEDIHYCTIVPTLIGLSWLAWRRGLWRPSLLPLSHGEGDRSPKVSGEGERSVGQRLRRTLGPVATWGLWLTLAVCCIPRMQELIYPSHLFAFPGQLSPQFGPLVVLLRSGILLYTALATLLAGAGVLWAAQRQSDGQAVSDAPEEAMPPVEAPARVEAPVGVRAI